MSSLRNRRDSRKDETNRAQKAIQDALGALQSTSAGRSVEPYSSGPVMGGIGQSGDFSHGFSESSNPAIAGSDLTEATFNTVLQKLIAASGGKITVTSGKRDSKRQQELWEQALKKYGNESAARKWVAPPSGYKLSDGTIAKGSRHEHGLAADLKYADDATRKWAHEMAKQYGLHFPLSNEPWHVEILGSR